MLLGGPGVSDWMKYTGGGPQGGRRTRWGSFCPPNGSNDYREHPDPTSTVNCSWQKSGVSGREHVTSAATGSESSSC